MFPVFAPEASHPGNPGPGRVPPGRGHLRAKAPLPLAGVGGVEPEEGEAAAPTQVRALRAWVSLQPHLSDSTAHTSDL